MGNYFTTVTQLLFGRRQDRTAQSHARLDHPERLHSDKASLTENVEQHSGSTVAGDENGTASIKATTVPLTSSQCSDFYLACRNNNVEKVRQSLQRMSLEEVDRLEPNGSTALHSACYHGHVEIVALLLQAGADRSIHNKFNYLPFDEARNDQIKALFFREPNTNRLVSNTGLIEWQLIDDHVSQTADTERFMIQCLYEKFRKSNSVKKMFESIEQNYIGKTLKNFDKIELIKRFFHRATEDEDPLWLLKAYTAETDFYKALNTEIACGAGQGQTERKYLIALICHHPKLDRFTFTGLTYRVVKMNTYDQQIYRVNCELMTQSFLSTSIDEKAVAGLVYQQETALSKTDEKKRFQIDGAIIKSWVLCKYTIKRPRTALHIEEISQYTNEGEVLIMPYAVFKVVKIEKMQPPYLDKEQLITVIELEEYEE